MPTLREEISTQKLATGDKWVETPTPDSLFILGTQALIVRPIAG